MSDVNVLPELKQIVGAMLFAAKAPLGVTEIKKCLQGVAEERGGSYADFGQLAPREIRDAIDAFRDDLGKMKAGFTVVELAQGFRLENDVSCGPWLRVLLQKGRANRLSKPALETLAIIAYRQPCTRAQIETVRGVAVDQILRNLMELQLVRITGRSELPGRPWLFGTTQKFLEYFGLRDVRELPGVDELRRLEEEQEKARAEKAGSDEPAVLAGEPAPADEPSAELPPDGESDEDAELTDDEAQDEYEDEYDDEDDDDEDDEDGDDADEELEEGDSEPKNG